MLQHIDNIQGIFVMRHAMVRMSNCVKRFVIVKTAIRLLFGVSGRCPAAMLV